MFRAVLFFTLLVTTTFSAETLRFGYDAGQFGRFNKKDTSLAISIWLKELASGSGYAIKTTAYEDVGMMAQDLKDKRLDLMSTSAYRFVKYFDKDLLEDGFTGGDSDSSVQRLYLVVKADAHHDGWTWLKDAKILGLEGSDISRLYLNILLLGQGLSDSVTWIDTRNYQQALLKLFFGKGDAAIVTEKALTLAIEMNPQVKERIRVFDKSKLTDLTPSYFRKGTDQTMLRSITDKALSISKTVRGRQLLEVFRSDDVIKIKVDSLLPVEEAYHSYMNSIKKERR